MKKNQIHLENNINIRKEESECMDINYVPLEKFSDKADNSIYKLVIIAANRAKEIAAGKPVLLETPKSDKPTTIALEEIAAGKVQYKKIKDKILKLKEDIKQEVQT